MSGANLCLVADAFATLSEEDQLRVKQEGQAAYIEEVTTLGPADHCPWCCDQTNYDHPPACPNCEGKEGMGACPEHITWFEGLAREHNDPHFLEHALQGKRRDARRQKEQKLSLVEKDKTTPPATTVNHLSGNYLEELNKRFAIISVGNKVVVMELNPDASIKELWPFPEFKRLLVKYRIRRDGKVYDAADLWLKSTLGRQYDRLVYAMPGSSEVAGADDYNGWLGFTVQPAPGDWSKNRAHILKVICNGNQAHFEWVYNWMAALVQQPGRHGMVAIVLRGGQGIGKGHHAHQMLGRCFSLQQYIHILRPDQLTGDFNEHLSGKCLVFADESTWGGDLKAAQALKGLVTESTVPIHRKFLKLTEEPSALHIIIATNNDWPISIDRDDRRFTILDVSEEQKQKDSYFGPLLDELEHGGRAAMLHDLMAHEVDWELTRRPLKTSAKLDIARLSLKPVERWWYEHLKTGRLSGQGWPPEIRKPELHGDYIDFLAKHHPSDRTRRSTETELGSFLQKHAGFDSQRRLEGDEREKVWTVPSLAECRAKWVAVMGGGDEQWTG